MMVVMVEERLDMMIVGMLRMMMGVAGWVILMKKGIRGMRVTEFSEDLKMYINIKKCIILLI